MNDLTVTMTVGNNQAIGINRDNHIVLIETKQNVITNYVSLGKLTRDRIRVLKDTLESLAIHLRD